MTVRRAERDAKLKSYLEVVGCMASEWAALEFQIDALIWDLAEIEQMLGACITTQLGSASARLRALGALLRLRDCPKPLLDKLNKFETLTHVHIQKRNRVVHDTWVISTRTEDVRQIRVAVTDKRLEFGFRDVPKSAIESDYDAVEKHVSKFLDLDQEIRLWLSTSPKQWRRRLHQIDFPSRNPKGGGKAASIPALPR